MDRWTGRRTMVGLLAVTGLNALVAAGLFVARPDGSGLGIPQAWLDGTPFHTYLIPGLLLGFLGLLCFTAAWLEFRRARGAWFASGLCAGGLVVWIVVQAAMMGSFRAPQQTVLQAAVLAVAVVVGLLALAQARAATASRA